MQGRKQNKDTGQWHIRCKDTASEQGDREDFSQGAIRVVAARRKNKRPEAGKNLEHHGAAAMASPACGASWTDDI